MSATAFLGSAAGRLLPASVPLRFFAAAAVFHVLTWTVVLATADQLPGFRGGLAPPLAAVHLLVLGVFATTAIGAVVQLLPVATRQPIGAVWPIKLVFWVFVPGLTLFAIGIYAGVIGLLIAGAVASAAALTLFAVLLAGNLSRATSMPVVAAFGWAATVALLATALLGLVLSLDFVTGWLPDHAVAARAHMILGAFGFMGMLIFGFSQVLIPMFALSSAPPKAPALVSFGLAVLALMAGSVGMFLNVPGMVMAAAAAGLGAAVVHVWLLVRTLGTGMRRRLGLSFVLVRVAWTALPLSIGLGLLAAFGAPPPNWPALFGLVLLGGWLLTFLLGILQRILPFLASMHASRAAGTAPLRLSELTPTAPLQVHAVCHFTALIGLGAAILGDVAGLARLAGVVGLCGALAFAGFVAGVLRRLRQARP